MLRFWLVTFTLAFLVACRPTESPQAAPIDNTMPTLATLPEGTPLALEAAERVARGYLEAWHNARFEEMYEYIAFTSQEAQTLADFIALYERAHSDMKLDSLSYIGNALSREGNIAVFNYSVTFNSRILGEFADLNRDLRLIHDTRANDWRVAWSPADIFKEMGDGGRLRLSPIIPPRANIYDQDGQSLADQNGRVVSIEVTRDRIPDYAACLNALSGALGQPVNVIQATLESRPPNWLMDMGIVEATTYEQTQQSLTSACAAQFQGKSVRRYSTGEITSNIIGYVGFPDEVNIPAVIAAGFESDSILGRSGIEQSWDQTLRGQPGGELSIVTANGVVLRQLVSRRSTPPQSLWLSLNMDLQREIARILADEYATQHWAGTSSGASVVMMDVKTGAILAMVTYPTFDNNAFNPYPEMGRNVAQQIVGNVQTDPRRPQLNRATMGIYPLGSVMKLVSASAVADSGVYALDERYTCTGVWSRDIVRRDWLAGGHGTITVAQSVTRSCNPFYYEVGYRLDSVDPFILPNYAREFGFGSPTGIYDVAESGGLIVDPDWWRVNVGTDWRFSESVNMAIGQGYLQVTPLQVVRMVASIANGGKLYRPYIVERAGMIGEEDSYHAEPQYHQLDVQPEVLAMVRQGMCDVADTPNGTAEFIFRDSPLQSIGICGKTGTAEAPSSPTGVSHAWFASYAPRDNPQIALIVMIENSGEGSGVAAPITRRILEYFYFGNPEP